MTSGTFNRRAFFHYQFTKLEDMRILAQNLRIMEYGQHNLQWYHKAGAEYGQCHLQWYHKAEYGQYDLQFIRQDYSPSFSNCSLQRGQVALLRKTIIYSKRKLLLGILMFGGVETMRRLTWWARRGGRGCVQRAEGCSQAGAAVEEEVSSLKELSTGERKKPRRQVCTPFCR